MTEYTSAGLYTYMLKHNISNLLYMNVLNYAKVNIAKKPEKSIEDYE